MNVVRMDTLRNPREYTQTQLDYALRVAYWLQRGKFVLCVEPDETRK